LTFQVTIRIDLTLPPMRTVYRRRFEDLIKRLAERTRGEPTHRWRTAAIEAP